MAEEVSWDRKWENVYFFRGNSPEEDFSKEKIQFEEKDKQNDFFPSGFHQKKIEFPGLVGGEIQEHLKFPRKSNFPWENKTSWNLFLAIEIPNIISCGFFVKIPRTFCYNAMPLAVC